MMLRMSAKFFSVCSSSEVMCLLALSSGQSDEGTFLASRLPWPSAEWQREKERDRERERERDFLLKTKTVFIPT